MISLADLMEAKNLNWTVAELLEAGRCTAQCLCAYDPLSIHSCSCPCRGVFHGQLSNTEVIEHARFATLEKLSETNIKYLIDGDSVYAWDKSRTHILAEGKSMPEARADLERITSLAMEYGLYDYEYSGSYVYTDSFDRADA